MAAPRLVLGLGHRLREVDPRRVDEVDPGAHRPLPERPLDVRLEPREPARRTRPARTRDGSGCPGGRTASPVPGVPPRRRGGSGRRRRCRCRPRSSGKPIDPPRGRTHSRCGGLALEEAVEQREVLPGDRAAAGDDLVAGAEGDQGQDLGRRRRADRRGSPCSGPRRRAAAGRASRASRSAVRPSRTTSTCTPRLTPCGPTSAPAGRRVDGVDLEEPVDLVAEQRRAGLGGDRGDLAVRGVVGEHPGRVVRRVDDDQPASAASPARAAARRRSPSPRSPGARGGSRRRRPRGRPRGGSGTRAR